MTRGVFIYDGEGRIWYPIQKIEKENEKHDNEK